MKPNKTLHIISSVSRSLLGLTFVFSGFVKAVDPLGTTYKIEDYLKAFGGVFTDLLPMAEVMAWCLIVFEFVLGVCLLLNVKTSWTSWATLAMMLVMTPITLYLALTNPITDCGCFGDAVVLSNWATFWKNVVLLVLVVVLLCVKRHIPTLFQWHSEIGIACLALGFAVGMMLYARLHLPIMDFRPYKVGNNIAELMEYPDDAEPDQYETLLIYEKDGQKQTFTLEDYPRGDSTWTFVDQKSTLVKKGYEPPIHDFEIITLDGEDMTDDVLTADRATLIVAYDMQKTDGKQWKKVLQLVQTAESADEYCYVLTGSGEDDIMTFFVGEEWSDEDTEMIREHFCQTDPVTLKTIVRANPGVVVLENGTVREKYNLRNK